MSGNKKSSLTGYLPDILMAAAAVCCTTIPCRPPADTPLLQAALSSINPRTDNSVAVDSLLCNSQSPRAPRPRSPTKRRSAAKGVGRNAQAWSDPGEQADGRLRQRGRGWGPVQEAEQSAADRGPGLDGVRADHCHGGRCARGDTRLFRRYSGRQHSSSTTKLTAPDIGGLDSIIEELKESVIYPLTLPHLYSHSSSLLSAPSGVLLYGPPGCGKTMLAKALAHESGACFINLHISTLTEKWYGDSNKLVNAVFSLARKLQPTIVFIDEIDAVLGQRRSGEHEASGMVKAEFMTHWDGLASSSSSGSTTPQRICILGATNRIQDIDEAILRRMPKKFPVALPSASQRSNIFDLILRGTKIDRPNFDRDYLVRVSAGMSGSDIKEACRDAAMGPVREYIRVMKKEGRLRGGRGVDPDAVRGLRTEDFFGRGRGLREAELDDVKDEVVNARDGSRRIHTTEESETSDSTSTESGGEDKFRDSAYQDAETAPVR
jgi:hypothetical protein